MRRKSVQKGGSMIPPLVVMDPVGATLQSVSMNPYVMGIAYILLNLGGRFLGVGLTPEQEKFLANPMFRPVLIFALCFMASRNLVSAMWLTILLSLMLYIFFNEQSAFNLFYNSPVKYEEVTDQKQLNGMPRSQPSPTGEPIKTPMTVLMEHQKLEESQLEVAEANYRANMQG